MIHGKENRIRVQALVHRAAESLHGLTRFADEARIGQLLLTLVAKSSTLIVSQEEIENEGGIDVNVSITAQMANSRVCTNRATLMEALESICGQEPIRICQTCKGAKRLIFFSRNRNTDSGKDGFAKSCKECQRESQTRHREKVSAQSGQSHPAPSQDQDPTS